MTTGLSVSDIVNVNLNLSPTAAASLNFGATLIVGPSTVIDVVQRMRTYSSIGGVASDFGLTAPEYFAAADFFAQVPQPPSVMIGRWASTATSAIQYGQALNTAQQSLSRFTTVTNGSLSFQVDGAAKTLTGVNLSSAANLPGVAGLIQAAGTGFSVIWDAVNGRFVWSSNTVGVNSSVSLSTAPGAGVDLGMLTGISQASTGLNVPGMAAETPTAAIQAMATGSYPYFYETIWAAPLSVVNASAMATYIEAASPPKILGITTGDPNVLLSTSTADVAYTLSQAGFKRTMLQYSSQDPYSVASLIGRIATVNFNGQNTTITAKFESEPGVVAETLTETQAAALNAKNCNVFVNYMNGAAIIQQGVMVNGYFIDTVMGTDWLTNAIQTAAFNALYTTTTKIPQTDAGVAMLVAAIAKYAMQPAVNNGLIAGGAWTGPSFGSIVTGQILPAGFYIYASPVAAQALADRQARKSPPIMIAAVGAGAIHSAAIGLNFTR